MIKGRWFLKAPHAHTWYQKQSPTVGKHSRRPATRGRPERRKPRWHLSDLWATEVSTQPEAGEQLLQSCGWWLVCFIFGLGWCESYVHTFPPVIKKNRFPNKQRCLDSSITPQLNYTNHHDLSSALQDMWTASELFINVSIVLSIGRWAKNRCIISKNTC